jgi:hypothetical protein
MFNRTWAQKTLRTVTGSALEVCTVLALAALGEKAEALSPGRAVEPPPVRYASGPTLTGATAERAFSNRDALEVFCNRHLGRPVSGYYQACYVPMLDLVVIPDRHAWPSAREREQLREHEWAHARGWRHAGEGVASEAPR